MERNQAGVINMKEKIINRLLEITGGLSVIVLLIGIYISLEFLGILWIGELLYWICMILISPFLLKAAYMFLKDVHQSNLDDIEEYQSEEKIEQSGFKEQIKSSLEAVALFWIILFILMCGILFIFVPELGLRYWLELLSIFPGILIFLFLIGKLVSTIEAMWKNKLDDTEEKNAEIIK
ncbi:hypothetical protein ABXT44_04330 [Candidatus Pseudothioglobus sp. Uisw_041]|uniref:hypothetical protein n=1 Tax=Candidatus Pseudothioglobus sp. Uisw_041 TaxID=3230996 RepID=UPI003A88B731